jgi:chromosome segregation ATPase
MRVLTIILIALFLAGAVSAQTASNDSQMTQTLINEIRQLRLDLQATAAVVQRAQILMYRLQVESGLLARATQRLDEARNRCSSLQSNIKSYNMQIEQYETRARTSQVPAEAKNFEDNANRMKAMLAQLTNEEQQCQPRQIDAQSQLQAAQARVDDFQSQLDRLDKLLAGVK